ncbi:Pyrrolidone-carboxylate peptidase [Serratia rubidaea]|uniref:Pyroglutamyl-peptidase I n=1 Tax=Serratia rubidaea TaxID=61652 RepID=A0A3S4H8L7_SERRU|nr:Pyrrolidone-carboxylate peptidase [Serratia rubidaea]
MQHTVLITGFEPFDGERVNPSWEVVKQLNDMELSGVRIVARQLPCVFGASLTALNAAIDELAPQMVLAVGQAGGRSDISLERVAINIDDARIPDNQGQQPIDEPIVATVRRRISVRCRSRRWLTVCVRPVFRPRYRKPPAPMCATT